MIEEPYTLRPMNSAMTPSRRQLITVVRTVLAVRDLLFTYIPRFRRLSRVPVFFAACLLFLPSDLRRAQVQAIRITVYYHDADGFSMLRSYRVQTRAN